MGFIIRDVNGHEKEVDYIDGKEIVLRQHWKFQEPSKEKTLRLIGINEPDDNDEDCLNYMMDRWWKDR